MDDSIYIAMTGAQQTLIAQAANAHNLANASTVGFRADLSQFRAMPVFGEGFESRAYAMAERPGTSFVPGALETTGRDLDVAIDGDGFFAVQAPDGTEAYTRAGDLQISSAGGLLETGAGHLVLGDGGPVALPPFAKLQIGADGTVSIVPLGQGSNELVQLDRIRLVNPPLETLEKGEDGLLRRNDGLPAEPDAAVRLVSGALESSNVNLVDGLVEMIALARRFELQVQMMQTTSENESLASELLQIN